MNDSKVKCYFITGTGRCGTKLFAKLFSLSKNSVCEHEKLFRHISMVKFYRDNDCGSYLDDINSHVVPKVESYAQRDKSYGISSGHLYFSIYYLYRVFGRSARFILLVRRPEEFVRSALARGFFDPDHPNSCIQIFPNPADDMFDKWDVTSPFEKCLWYWRLVNQFVLYGLRRMPKDIYKIVRIEDVNVGLVKQLCEFLELSDIRTEAIEATLAQRVNASPCLGDERDVNQMSLPITFEPIEKWNDFQLSLLEKYTGELREQLYGLDFPLKKFVRWKGCGEKVNVDSAVKIPR